MENKKGAPTAATVRSAKTNSQVQFIPNSWKTQGTSCMKYPVDAKNLLIAYMEETGDRPDDYLRNLYAVIAALVNQAYEDGRLNALAQFATYQKGGAQV